VSECEREAKSGKKCDAGEKQLEKNGISDEFEKVFYCKAEK
jgi:hypothetical protein